VIVETVLWKSLQWSGHESARLLARDDGWLLEGTAAFAHESNACRLDYAIECDRAWATRSARVQGWVGAREVDVTIEVVNGDWILNGVEQKQVAGCIDIDLNFSPSTNLLPIRRIDPADESIAVRAAWLRFPSFELEPLEQRYTRIAADRVSYASTNFTALLHVSPNGLVRDYETLWTAER